MSYTFFFSAEQKRVRSEMQNFSNFPPPSHCEVEFNNNGIYEWVEYTEMNTSGKSNWPDAVIVATGYPHIRINGKEQGRMMPSSLRPQ